MQRPEIFKRREGDQQRPGFGQQGAQQGGFKREFRPGQGQGQGGHAHRPGGGQRPTFISREQKEIDKKEIQDKIRETQAKLAGSGGRGKSLKAKYRRAKRDEVAESTGDEMQDNKLQLTEFISVSELANLMDVSYA